MLTIHTGGKEVIGAVTFLTLGLGETKLVLEHRGERITFIFDFVTAESEKQVAAYSTVDEQTLRIKLVNWSSPFGSTLMEPMHVGTIAGRDLSILYFVAKAGDTGEFRRLTFTAFAGEELQDGSP